MSNSILCYHVKHSRPINDLLEKAERVANYAVQNKNNFKLLSSKYVKNIGTGSSAIDNQILRKYGRGTIKKVSNINIIVPNQVTRNKKTGKEYFGILYDKEKEEVFLKSLKMSFRWNPGREFKKINQVEISKDCFMVTCTFKNEEMKQFSDTLGIDLNCGVGRHIVNAANLKTGEVLNLGKQGPNMRKRYFKKRKVQLVKGCKERRIMRDLDHKISHKIVNYALKNKLKIILEDLKGIRTSTKKGKGSKTCNRLVNSWSFYRLQQMIEYKSKELGIPLLKVKPHYTSQQCSYCGVIGNRDRKHFICKNKHCCSYKKERNSDINAAFNIAKRGSSPEYSEDKSEVPGIKYPVNIATTS